MFIVYSFLDSRLSHSCKDKISLILYTSQAYKICERYEATNAKQFVENYCLTSNISGGTHFGNAIQAAEKIIKNNEQTVFIFLTDGQCCDCKGTDNIKASDRVGKIKSKYKELQFWAIKFCKGSIGSTLNTIAQAGGTKVEVSTDVIKLNELFVNVIAKKAPDFGLKPNNLTE